MVAGAEDVRSWYEGVGGVSWLSAGAYGCEMGQGCVGA